MDRILHDHNRLLLRQYHSASSDLCLFLTALQDELLPQLALKLQLSDKDITWLSEWLSDTVSIFHLLKGHNFTSPVAKEEICAILIWRLRVLRPVLFLPGPTLFYCLPPPITDPLGHPMLFLKLASLQTLSCSIKGALLQEVECLRLHLRHVRDHYAYTGSFPLQYLLLVDLDGISIQKNSNLDLCSSLLTDIISRYPGMLAAVFLLNYSWIHSGAWSVVKRILPSSAITRVFFPSNAQLLSYCSAAALPAEYGGSLPNLDQIGDALRSPHQTHPLPSPPPPSPPLPSPSPPPSDLPVTPAPEPRILGENASPSDHDIPPTEALIPQCALAPSPSTIALPPFSPRNPFFGYPAIASARNPHMIRHVRRGLPELARTLAVLWWRRWGRWALAWTYSACACGLLWVLMQRARRASVRALIDMASPRR